MALSYRTATRDDQAALRRLLFYAVSVPPGATPPTPEVLELPELARYAEGFGTAVGDHGIVAEHEHAVVGGAWLRLWTPGNRGYGFVDDTTPELSMAVEPDYRGHGIGTELLRRLLSHAAEHHARVSLSVAEYNPAQRLYQRFGFSAVGRDGDSITMLWSRA